MSRGDMLGNLSLAIAMIFGWIEDENDFDTEDKEHIVDLIEEVYYALGGKKEDENV